MVKLPRYRLALSLVCVICMMQYFHLFEMDSSWMTMEGIQDYETGVGRMGDFSLGGKQKGKQKAMTAQQRQRKRARVPYVPHGPNQLTAIRLIGERHSGTNWITILLETCFPTINVNTALVTQKHWFQFSPQHVVEMVNEYSNATAGLKPSRVKNLAAQFTYETIAKQKSPKSIFNKTFVVALFRNPYDWMNAMKDLPHHWPNHFDFKEYQKLGQLMKKKRTKRGGSGGFDAAGKTRRDNMMKRVHAMRRKRKAGRGGRILTDFLTEPLSDFDPRRRLDMPLEEDDIQEDDKEEADDASPSHALPWHEFVNRTMTIGNDKPNGVRRLCQKGYQYGTISPCVSNPFRVPPGVHPFYARDGLLPGSSNDAVYELQDDGTPFKHPLALRAAKISNFMNLSQQWDLGGFLSVSYDDLKEQGTHELVATLAKAFDVRPSCGRRELEPSKKSRGRTMDPDFQDWVTQNADWTVEARVGYKPRE